MEITASRMENQMDTEVGLKENGTSNRNYYSGLKENERTKA